MQSAVALNNALLDAQSKMPEGAVKLDLPLFVVVGAQSSGKSSVLDNVIGRSFLPRGSGTVTRRPLVLMMQQCGDEYATFTHLPGQRFFADADITQAINQATYDKCGAKSFSAEPIHMHYYSPNVPDLTLVDLPGVIKAAAADMDARDPEIIKSMVMKYATKPNSILLAVTPAVADLVTSDAIQLAKEVDPEGVRTLGVLTKLDLMDEGTDCAAALCGEDPRAPKLRLGYVAVVNRGQKDINNGVDLTAAREKEHAFFTSHEVYGALTGGAARLGTKALVETSSSLLVEHIERSLPELKGQIIAQLDVAERQLKELSAVADPHLREQALVTAVANARMTFSAHLNPGAASAIDHTRFRAFSAGEDIESIFVNLMRDLKAEVEHYNFGELDRMQRQMAGVGGMLFDVDQTFRFLVRQQTPKFDVVCQALVEKVYARLQQAINEMELSTGHFVMLEAELRSTFHSMVQGNLQPTRELCGDLVRMEAARINLAHPAFIARPDNIERFSEQMTALAKQAGPTYGATKKISDVVFEGDAFKRRKKGGLTLWHQRHLILMRTGQLLWYEPSDTRGADNAKGSLRLTGCTVTRGSSMGSSSSDDETAVRSCSHRHNSSNRSRSRRAPSLSTSQRRTLCISGGDLKESECILLELADEAKADEWEKHIKAVIESLEVHTGEDQKREGEGSSELLVRETDDCKRQIRQLTEAARVNHYKLVHMVESYVNIVCHQLCDTVPKAITERLLNATTTGVTTRIDASLGRGSVPAAVEELMQASPEQAAQLKKLQAEVTSLRECRDLVAHVKRGAPASAAPSLGSVNGSHDGSLGGSGLMPRSPNRRLTHSGGPKGPARERSVLAADGMGARQPLQSMSM